MAGNIQVLRFALAVIRVESSQQVYDAPEQGPSVMICLDLIEGFVGPQGATIMVDSTGGTAAGERMGLKGKMLK